MDSLQTSSFENDLKPVLKLNACAPTHFRNNFHSVKILEDLQSLRKNEVLCDIRFEADDGKIIIGHKIVLIAASPYFRAMFSHFDESNKDIVNIRELDSTALQILVDYIYTGEFLVTTDNVQVLLSAANVFQLEYVNKACAEFLQKQLNTSNCFGIRAFADLHNCTDLLSSSEAFIKKQFLEVVKSDEFLSLSSEDLVKIISCDDLAVPYEEKVFDCVIKWVKHDLDHRKAFLPELMEHVRLPLLKPDILFNIYEEPLLKYSPKCKDYVFDALQFNLQKSIQHIAIPKTIRCKPRLFGGSQKVILIFNQPATSPKCFTHWYDPATKLQENAPRLNDRRQFARLGVLKDQFVFVVGGVNESSSKSVSMLDVSSKSLSWWPLVDMLVSRNRLGVGVLDNCIYAVGGSNGISDLNSVEVFDVSNQEWRMVTSMFANRRDLGVGVLNNCLYAVGGADNVNSLKSVECYDPILDTWTPVPEMSVCRQGVSVGVMDGLMYAIGGYDEEDNIKSVEVYRPSDGFWYFIADMQIPRFRPGVAVLDGLLYVIGGECDPDDCIDETLEIYNPITNTWTLETLSKRRSFGGVVVNRPPHLK